MNKYYFIFFVLLLSCVVYAEPSFFYQKGSVVDLKIPCIDNNSLCGSGTQCNATVNYPNGTNYFVNSNMTNNIAFFNKTLPNSNITGEYSAIIYCCNGGSCSLSSFSFMINNSGNNEKPSGLIVILILIPLCLSIIFIVSGISMSYEHIALKIASYLFSLVNFFVSLWFGTVSLNKFYLFPELEDALGIWIYVYAYVFAAIVTYFIIHLIIKALNAAGELKEAELEY